MSMETVIKLRNLIERKHGCIDTVYLSYCTEDSPSDPVLYQKWLADTNKVFEINYDSHDGISISEVKELKPYLDLHVSSWDIFEQDGKTILDVDLY